MIQLLTTPTWRPRCAVALLCAAAAGSAIAAPSASQVFTCVGPTGRMLTSDRLIAACMDREQRVLARDGTLLRIVPPSLTADERTEKEARDRRAATDKATKDEAVRRDRNLLQRYPDAASHERAREAALADLNAAIKQSEQRQRDLVLERKPLLDEAEFYKGKTMPAKLRQQFDANDGATAAQRDAQVTQKAEMERVTKLFDAELTRLKRLWAGAVPGSLGPATAEAAVATPPVVPGKPVAARQ